jgi:hypothetical protein
VSASTTSCLASIQARAHAAQGDAAGCDRALDQLIDQFSSISPVNRPPWGAHLDDTSLAARQGGAHYALAMVDGEQRTAERAVPLLRQAVDAYGPDYAKLRALYLPDLAGAHALAGDLDAAISVGHQALDAVTASHSAETYDGLRVLSTVLDPLHTIAGVAELRDRLTTTAT